MTDLQQVVGGAIGHLVCLDSDDVEDFLVEEGIGHRDRGGNFQYGPAIELEHVPDEHDFDKEETGE
jgi:hypothetical protein